MYERVHDPFAERLDQWLSRWLEAWNGFMVLYVALPLAAPLLAAAGLSGLAGPIYTFYSYACHQDPGHSWFLLGHQVAYCQRDVAIYTSMLIAGLWYSRIRGLRGIPFWALVLLSLPIAIDGGSATLGLRDSTPLLRTLTGTLFGVAAALFIYPLIDRYVTSTSPTRAA